VAVAADVASVEIAAAVAVMAAAAIAVAAASVVIVVVVVAIAAAAIRDDALSHAGNFLFGTNSVVSQFCNLCMQ
jgi:hypothetical protein